MSGGQPMSDDLGELLRHKVALLDELHGLLEQETAALAERRHEPMLVLAEDKQRLGIRLMELSHALNEVMRRKGYVQDAEGFARCVREDPDSGELTRLYEKCMKTLRACAVHNQTNGGLVERRRSAVERALRLFFDGVGDASRYHPSGRLEGIAPNRLIGEA